MSGSDSMKSKNILYYIHVAIYLLISFGFGFLPPIGAITHFGMQGLGIFLGLLYGWIFWTCCGQVCWFLPLFRF